MSYSQCCSSRHAAADPKERSRKELADLIAEVKNHPLCPGILADNILEALYHAEKQAYDMLVETPEGIAFFLRAHEAQDRQRRAEA